MKLNRILIGMGLALPLAGAALAGAALAGPFDPGPLWQDGRNAARTIPCFGPGDYEAGKCLALQVQSATGPSTLGQGYIEVKVLWSKKPGQAGPDLILLGDYGGSGGNADLYAIGFSPKLRALPA